MTAGVPSVGTSVTRTLIRSVRDRWRLSAARALRVSLTLIFSREGAVAVRRPVPVDVVRRPIVRRRAVVASTVDFALSFPALFVRANRARTPVRAAVRIFVVLPAQLQRGRRRWAWG